MARIVPHSEAGGVDFCGGLNDDLEIIRSDLECYMRVSDLHTGKDATLHPLHPSCSGGDHYLAMYHAPGIGANHKSYYIIKGRDFRRVTDLTTDANPKVGVLHEKCRNGVFYLGTSQYLLAGSIPIFIIVFNDKFRVVSNLETGKKDPGLKWKDEYHLKKEMRGGLYYCSTKTKTIGTCAFYAVKQVDKWGLQYYRTSNPTTEPQSWIEPSEETSSFHPSVTNFLPGGLGVTMGPAIGDWVLFKSFENLTDEIAEGQKYVVKVTNGYRKQSFLSTERDWRISASGSKEESAGLTIEKVFEVAVKKQLSLSGYYGGKSIKTTTEEWKEEVTEEDTVQIPKLHPGKSAYVWQYNVKLEKTDNIVRSKNLAVTETPTPPSTNPFTQEKNID